MKYPGPVLIIGAVGTLRWIVIMLIRHRHSLIWSWLIVPGGLAGFTLVTIPDLLLHYA